MNSNIYAVIVTYNPELKNLNALITELKEQNCYVVVVDNSTNFTLKDKLADIEKVHLICLGRNEGIAKAQNIGIRYSFETMVPDEIVTELLNGVCPSVT